MSDKEIAEMLLDLFGDPCACNFKNIDEWLPKYCEYCETECCNITSSKCWEQFVKYYQIDRIGSDEE